MTADDYPAGTGTVPTAPRPVGVNAGTTTFLCGGCVRRLPAINETFFKRGFCFGCRTTRFKKRTTK